MLGKQDSMLLSQAVIFGIKRFCFNNVTEFHKRYKNALEVSKPTLYRLLSGAPGTAANVRSVESLAFKLGIINEDGHQVDNNLKVHTIRAFIEVVDEHLAEPSVETLNRIQVYLNKNKAIMLS